MKKFIETHKRLWKFAALIDGHIHYLLIDGRCVSDPVDAPNWIGSDNEADKEAERRCELHEDLCGGFVERVTYESQGKVDTPSIPRVDTAKKAMPPGSNDATYPCRIVPSPEQEVLNL